MSVESITLHDLPVMVEFRKSNIRDHVLIRVWGADKKPISVTCHDRNQIHMLKLWLEDQLK